MYMHSDIIFVEKCEYECKKLFLWKSECECKKVEKVENGCDLFLPSLPRIPPQFVHISYFLWLPQKSICLIFLLRHLKSSSSFSSFFVLLPSSLLTRQHLSLPFSPKILVSLKKKFNN